MPPPSRTRHLLTAPRAPGGPASLLPQEGCCGPPRQSLPRTNPQPPVAVSALCLVHPALGAPSGAGGHTRPRLADGAHFKSMLWTLRGAGKPQDTPQSVHPPTLPDTLSLETLVLRLSWRPGCLSPQKKTRQALPPSTGPRPDCPPRPAAGPSAFSCRAGRPPGLRVRSFLPDRIVFPATVPFASHAINFSLYQILPGSVQACCFFCHF